jgi:hypothetical protein
VACACSFHRFKTPVTLPLKRGEITAIRSIASVVLIVAFLPAAKQNPFRGESDGFPVPPQPHRPGKKRSSESQADPQARAA